MTYTIDPPTRQNEFEGVTHLCHSWACVTRLQVASEHDARGGMVLRTTGILRA